MSAATLRHYLVAALRNMAANRLQSTISILGLALGLAAAILAGMVIHNQLTYDSFLPDHERLYVAGLDAVLGGSAPVHYGYAPHAEAAKLASFTGVDAVARLCLDFDGHSFRHGAVKGVDFLNCADPNIFDLLQLKSVYGDLATALQRPDTIVIPLSAARKYFGVDNAVGQILEVDGKHNLSVAAVVADLPFNGSNLHSAIFVSSKAAWTDLAKADNGPRGGAEDFTVDTQTFLRLSPHADAGALAAQMRARSGDLLPHPRSATVQARLISLSELHASPDFSPGLPERLAMLAAVALAILLLSGVNFVNLTTARAARRAGEVGARKALGAGRGALMLQFLGEAMAQAFIALLIALACLEWLAPLANNILDADATLTFGRNGLVALALVAGTLLVGTLAGLYPAFILSALRPAMVMKGGPLGLERAGALRQSLVIVQFAILVILAIGAGVFMAQYHFALSRTVAQADRLLFVQLPKCDGSFRDAAASLPGVEATACTDISLIKEVESFANVRLPGGGALGLGTVTAGPGLLAMFGQKPIAGRDLVLADHMADEPKAGDPPVHVLVNQMTLRKIGIATPQAAIGHAMRWDDVPVPVIIVGVVRDFSTYALEKPVGPTAYVYRDAPSLSPLVALKLKAGDHGTVLAATEQEWKRSGGGGAFQNIFLKDWMNRQRLSLLYEGLAAAGFAGVALLLGCLGLLGLSLSAAERRTKEIGVRKAMGASLRDVMLLLLWQFAKPVLWANLLAWPLAFWAMQRWLDGFAFHAAMPLWLFPAVGAATVFVALLTVAGQAWMTARAKPVLALRYE